MKLITWDSLNNKEHAHVGIVRSYGSRRMILFNKAGTTRVPASIFRQEGAGCILVRRGVPAAMDITGLAKDSLRGRILFEEDRVIVTGVRNFWQRLYDATRGTDVHITFDPHLLSTLNTRAFALSA